MELLQQIPLSIKFLLNGYPKIQKESYLIHAQLLLNRTKTTVSIKMNAKPDEWDFENGRYLANKQFNLVRNNKLNEIKEQFISLYFEAKKSGLPVSLKTIKNQFKGDEVQSNDLLFVDYFRSYIEELKLKVNEYGEGTIQHYIKTQTHLHRFLKKNGWMNIKLCELSRKFLEKFELYLLTTPNEQTGRPMNGNTCTTYIRKIKASINAAIRKELLQNNPFIGFKIRTFKQVNKVFLSMEELEAIKTNDLAGNYSLNKVKDVFLFSCYTGLRHSDVLRLNEKMIRKDHDGIYWISLLQQKTGDIVEIPMMDEALKLYHKYSDFRTENNGKVLPVMSNQKINAALKVIAGIVGINKTLSFHCARHTFATTTLEKGIDIKTVSGLLGHGSIRSTEVYAKLTRKRKAEALRILNNYSSLSAS